MIYALPGMGADHGMYPNPWQTLPDCVLLDWPVYAGEKSIQAMAKRIVEEAKIKDGDFLIGSSLGGIVACEITNLRSLRGLFLAGSAKKKEEISGLLSMLLPFANLAPIEFIQRAAGKFPNEVTRMFSRSQADFIRAMCHAIFDWKGLDETRTKPIRIHGKKDRVIPLPPDVQKIVDGGHLIAMTHAQECVDFIKSRLSQ
jgi:hypothetical protein